MNKPTRILAAISVSLALGGMNVYQDSVKMTPHYQAHPVVTILANFFWAGLIAGSIVYFGSGWLAKRKGKKLNKTNNPSGGDAHSEKVDDKFYDEVARELQEKSIVPGIWTKAFAEMDGDDAKTRALYIRYRVQQLVAEAARLHESVEQKRNREIALIRNRLGYLIGRPYKDDERIPDSQFEGHPNKFLYPVNASVAADALGFTEAGIIIAIRSGEIPGVKCDGEWFIDLGERVN